MLTGYYEGMLLHTTALLGHR